MKNILVLLDFSSLAEKVVAHAAQLALQWDAQCWLLHVAAPDPEFVGYDVGPQHERDFRAEVLKNERKQLAAWQEKLQKQGVEAEALLVQGQTVDTIFEEAEKLKADLLVMGRHNHGVIHELIAGSVAREVIKKTSLPVYVVPE